MKVVCMSLLNVDTDHRFDLSLGVYQLPIVYSFYYLNYHIFLLSCTIYLADSVRLVVCGYFQVPFKTACHSGV